jgi:hypothetical protein
MGRKLRAAHAIEVSFRAMDWSSWGDDGIETALAQ